MDLQTYKSSEFEVPSQKILALETIKELSGLLQEFDGAGTAPNVVILDTDRIESITRFFPYLIHGEVLRYNARDLKIVESTKNFVGVAMAFYNEPEYD